VLSKDKSCFREELQKVILVRSSI